MMMMMMMMMMMINVRPSQYQDKAKSGANYNSINALWQFASMSI